MKSVNYYTQGQAEDAMAVVAGWIGRKSDIRVQYHEGTAVDADINNGVIRIPRMACATGVTEEALMLLRHRVYHEAGHIDETDVEKPAGALGEIMNALEDRRMEASEAKKHKGCEVVFRWGNEWYNKDIASKAIENGGLNAPLWEALVAMSFGVEGFTPAWTLSDKANAYVDAAYDEFAKVKLCKNAEDCVELAKKILALLKDANEQYKQENPDPQEEQQGQSQPQEDDEKQDGEPQSGGQSDVDDDEESEESGKGEGDDADSDDEEDGNESGKGSDSDEDGDENGQSNGQGSEGDDVDSDPGQSKGGEKKDGPDADNEHKPGGERQQGGAKDADNEDDEWRTTDLEEELDGQSKDDALNDAIKDYIDDIDPNDAAYLSRRDSDEHHVPETDDRDKVDFKAQHEEIAVMTATMTRSLEQALRSICRCKREGYKRQGRIDHKRLTAIAKGLSRDVFFKIRDGQNLECAVEIVIDESGSMRNYRDVRLLAIAIGEALSSIGVPFEITGTTTKYSISDNRMPDLDGMTRTNPIIYNHYVMFGEAWDTVKHRLVHTGNHDHNIDGEAIEYCAFRLGQRKERRKIIFSLSDGSPEGGQGTEDALGQNIKRVCGRVRQNGIEVYGFGIVTKKPESYYGEEFFVYLPSILRMDQVFIKKFADVVTGGRVRI